MYDVDERSVETFENFREFSRRDSRYLIIKFCCSSPMPWNWTCAKTRKTSSRFRIGNLFRDRVPEIYISQREIVPRDFGILQGFENVSFLEMSNT